MKERSRVLTAASAGAAIGGAFGWLYLTDTGRRLRNWLEPALDRFVDDVRQTRALGAKTKAALSEGRGLLTQIKEEL